MAELLHRFSGNPFATPVGQKIEQATDPMLTSENWALNMEICDLVNETEDGARDAVRAIKKRLQQNGKVFTTCMYTLTVLETCVKNCGKRFHILVTNKDFVQDLVKLIGPKNGPPAEVQKKVLSLIQSWAEAFHGQADYQGVSLVYNELRNKGIEFPKSSSEPKVPIHTPQRSISRSNDTSLSGGASGSTSSTLPMSTTPSDASSSTLPLSRTPPTTNVAASTGSGEIYPIHLSPEQLNKMKNELETVQGNMKVLSEMLAELQPGREHKDDWELLVQLKDTCQAMQKRIVDLIEKVANEEVTGELLRINDELNNLFMRFERYQKKRGHNSDGQADNVMPDLCMPSTSTTGMEKKPFQQSQSKPPANTVPSLIDFTDDEPDALTGGIGNLKLSNNQLTALQSNQVKTETASGDQEFDMFAQLRSTTTGTATTGTPTVAPTRLDLLELDPVAESSTTSIRPAQPTTSQSSSTSANPSHSFEQFLQSRADALEQQPLRKGATYSQDSSLI